LPWLFVAHIERIEAGSCRKQRTRYYAQQTLVTALTRARGKPCERRQHIDALICHRRATEHMQAIADLRFFEVAQVRVDRLQELFVVASAAWSELAIQLSGPRSLQDLAPQHPGARRVEHQRLIIFIDQALQIAQGAVVFGARQRRHEVTDQHRLRAPLRLCALARVIHDERIHVRQRPEDRFGPATRRQRHALARQPLEIAVFAHVHDRLHVEYTAQPRIKRDVVVRGHQVGIVVRRKLIQLVASRGLNADEHRAEPQPRDRDAPGVKARILLDRPPTRVDRCAQRVRQCSQKSAIIVERERLQCRPRVKLV
jgi:hypothetical protein